MRVANVHTSAPHAFPFSPGQFNARRLYINVAFEFMPSPSGKKLMPATGIRNMPTFTSPVFHSFHYVGHMILHFMM